MIKIPGKEFWFSSKGKGKKKEAVDTSVNVINKIRKEVVNAISKEEKLKLPKPLILQHNNSQGMHGLV